MIGRKRYNNDTAYFTEGDNKGNPFGARLNDVVNNRFRLISITPSEVTLQDVDLGFKHRVAISKQVPGTPGINPGGKPGDNGFASPFDPGSIPTGIAPSGDIPGIPGAVQRFSPNSGQGQPSAVDSAPQKKPIEKKDVDDSGDD